MIFRTHAEASAFYEWLADFFSMDENKGKTATIGGYTLRFRDNDLTGKMYGKYTGFRIFPYYR